MRTTIHLPDDLLAELKNLAARSNRTLTRVIEDALRESLFRRRRKSSTPAPNLTTFGTGGLQPGVDLDDSAALLERMESR